MFERRHLALLPASALFAPLIVRAQELERSQDLVQGFSRTRLARFQPAMEREIAQGSFNGAVILLARNGEIFHHEAYGHQDNARRVPMSREAVFPLASMSKPIISVLAMTLMEEGRLKLSDNIAQYLPELRDLKVEHRTADGFQDVALQAPVTVRDLLRHTAGFIYSNAPWPSSRIREMYLQNDIEARAGPLPGDEMLKRLGTIPLAFQPGQLFNYSISTDVLGLLLERAGGKRLDHLLTERLTAPLGMRDTTWWVDPGRRRRLPESPSADPLAARYWRIFRPDQDPTGKTYFSGGNGLVATSTDYFRFAQMLASGGALGGRRCLSPATVNLTLSDHLGTLPGDPAPGYGFGLGFAVRRQEGLAVVPGSPGEVNWSGAWGTTFMIDRAEKLVAVFMAQGPGRRGHTRLVFRNLVYGAMAQSLRG